jgi:hypothetical protein
VRVFDIDIEVLRKMVKNHHHWSFEVPGQKNNSMDLSGWKFDAVRHLFE